MAAPKQPAIVAELGRPETPAETAERRAENSRRHRASQTVRNLVLAMLASLALVLFLVVVVVRPNPGPPPAVDYLAIAAAAGPGATVPLLAPRLPAGWSANSARFQPVAEVPTWYVGLITPSNQFIALSQGIGANPTWQAAILNKATRTGTATIAGLTWDVFDQRTAQRPGNFAYSLTTNTGSSTIVLHGTAPTPEFELVAAAIAAEPRSR